MAQGAGLWVETSMHCEESFVLTSVVFISSCGHLIIPAEYVMTSRVYVFMAWILFIAFIWVLKTCLIFWSHLAVAEICTLLS